MITMTRPITTMRMRKKLMTMTPATMTMTTMTTRTRKKLMTMTTVTK